MSDSQYSFLAEPPEFEATSFGVYPLAFAFGPWVAEGDSPASQPIAHLVRQPEKTLYPEGVISVGLDGTTLVATVGNLVRGQDYYLIVGVSLGANKKPTAAILIRTPI